MISSVPQRLTDLSTYRTCTYTITKQRYCMEDFTLNLGEKRVRRWLDGDTLDRSPQSDDSDATLPLVPVPDPLPEEEWKRQRPDMFLSIRSATVDTSKRYERATKDLGPCSTSLGRYRTQDGLITSRRLNAQGGQKGQVRAGSTGHMSRRVARGGRDRIERRQRQNNTWRNTERQMRRISRLAASIEVSITTDNGSAEEGRSERQRLERSQRGNGHVRRRRTIPVSRVSSR